MKGPDLLDKVRRSTAVRIGATIFVVVGLLAAGFLFNDRITSTDKTVTAVSGILARTCGSASFAELEAQGLVEECRLAQEGDLAESIPEDDLPEVTTAPNEVNPDVIKDDPDSTPADVQPAPGVSAAQVQTVVAPVVQDAVTAYFDDNPLPTTDGYQRAIRRAVVQYLAANPPEPGPAPTPAQIQDAVRVALVANPPADGVDGEDGEDGATGRGVATAAIAGCDVVFTFTDGTTQRVGPLCGTDGQDGADPTTGQIADAVASYCAANGECRGPAGPPGVVQTEDDCQPQQGEVVLDVTPAYDASSQSVIIRCTTGPPPGILGGGGGGDVTSP